MGAGASAQLSPEEQAKYDELRALSPEAQQALAAAAMLDVLTAAAAHACAEGGKPETWAPGADGAVPCPRVGDFEAVAEAVGKVPMVGKSLAGAVLAPVEKATASFADAALTVSQHPGTLAGLNAAIAAITKDEAVALATGSAAGASAAPYSAFLLDKARDDLTAALSPVVAEVLATHSITELWGKCISGYNSAAAKLPDAIATALEFDLPAYVLAQTFATLGGLLAAKECAVRAGGVEGLSEATVKIFGGGPKLTTEAAIKPCILVKKGDPRALKFVLSPLPPEVQTAEGITGADGTWSELKTAEEGFVLVQQWAKAKRIGGGAEWMMVGVGQPEVAAEGGAGAAGGEGAANAASATVGGKGKPLRFTRFGKFLCATGVDGDADPTTVKVLDVANWRYYVGNGIGVCSHPTKSALQKNGGRDFQFNEDGTVSPAKGKGKKFVLGIKLVRDGKAFTVG